MHRLICFPGERPIAFIFIVLAFFAMCAAVKAIPTGTDPVAGLVAFKGSDVEWFEHLRTNVGLTSADLYQCALEQYEAGDPSKALWVIAVGESAGFEITDAMHDLAATCVAD